MAKLWIVYREGLRLVGAVAGEADLTRCIATLDVAPWRFFTVEQPVSVSLDQARNARGRTRALVEVVEQDRYDLCPFSVGFFESPYSPEECLRRLNRASPAALEAGS